jgi:mutator protein MutT
MSLAHGAALRGLIADRLAAFAPLARSHPPELKRAAVAIAVAPTEAGEAAFLLTRRARRLRAHAGQLALPGGRIDAGETIHAAVLRELAEELGIAVAAEAILGVLDDYPTRSGYLISPVVVWLPAAIEPSPSAAEVAQLFRIGLAELRRPEAPEIFSIPESDRPVIRLKIASHGFHINAPTAAMLYQFREVALEGRATRVDHFDQPVWAWR